MSRVPSFHLDCIQRHHARHRRSWHAVGPIAAILVVTAGFLTVSDVAAAEKVKRLPIVDRAIAYHGGDRYTSSETTLDSCSKSGCSRVRARLDDGRFDLEVEGSTRAGTLRVRADNDSTLAWLDGRPLTLDREQAVRRRDWLMQRVYFAFLPFRLNDPSVWKEDLGLETWGDRTLHRVRISFTPGSSTDADDAYTYWFDAQTAQVVRFAYEYDGAPGGIRFRRTFNPRRIGGILFFDQENYGAEGSDLSVDMITPEFAETLPLVSTVRFENIRVGELP